MPQIKEVPNMIISNHKKCHSVRLLKRLWEQWTQHIVRGAFRPTIAILPIENLQGNCVRAVFSENPTIPWPGFKPRTLSTLTNRLQRKAERHPWQSAYLKSSVGFSILSILHDAFFFHWQPLFQPWLPNLGDEKCGPICFKILCGADLLETFNVPGLWKEEDIIRMVKE